MFGLFEKLNQVLNLFNFYLIYFLKCVVDSYWICLKKQISGLLIIDSETQSLPNNVKIKYKLQIQ